MFKQAIVIRKDLDMGKGKIAAQAAHASIGAAKEAGYKTMREWERSGSAKIVLKVDNEEQLMLLSDRAEDDELPFFVVTDAGKTQVDPGTATALAIGPAESDRIDRLTKDLRLL